MFREAMLDRLQIQIEPLEKYVDFLSAKLGEPKMMDAGKFRGFRYESSDISHFCLLKLARAVSGLNAAVTLARGGYVQEVMALLRTILEFTRDVEAGLVSKDRTEKHCVQMQDYVRKYLEDSRRGDTADIKKVEMPSNVVTQILSEDMDRIAVSFGETPTAGVTEGRYKAALKVLHPYIHAKYPEAIDLFGGTPGHFHLRGMLDTPKDRECFEFIRTYVETVSITVTLTILQLGHRDLIKSDTALSGWYARRME